MDVETETTRDWAKDVDTETPSRLSLISDFSKEIKLNVVTPFTPFHIN